MSRDLQEQVIAVIGKFDSGKTTFIKAVSDAATNAAHGSPAVEETPTLGIVEYSVPLPGGRVLTFLDTPGLDGYHAGGGQAQETEEILQMLEEHIAAKGATPVTHVLVFLSANDMDTTEFKGRARRTFERLFPNSEVVCITTHWDQIEGDDGLPITAEEAKSKEEGLYGSGTTSGSLLEYLHTGREGNILHFRSGLSIEAYSFPQDIIRKLFGGRDSDSTLEERSAAMTKERDDLAAKYELLLQEKGASTTPGEPTPSPKDGDVNLGPKEGGGESAPGRNAEGDDSTLGPKDNSCAPRTRRQRLLDTIDAFSAHVVAMVTGLEREALDVAHECKTNRQEFEAASAEVKLAETRFAEELENVKAVVDEYTRLRQEKETLLEQERSLTAELAGPQSTGSQSPVRAVPGQKQRLAVRLQQAQAHLKDTESWMTMTEGDYQKGCEQVELAAVEIEKLKRIAQGKERELSEWLSPESGWFTKELENFRAVRSSISTSLDAMRDGLLGGWEGKLGDNAVFLDGLGGCTVRPEMVAHPKDWALVIEPFFLSQVSLALSKEMAKFYSAVLQRLKIQEESSQREWKKGAEAIFEQPVSSFKKSSLPQLIPPAEAPQGDLPEDSLIFSKEPGAGVPSQDLPPPLPPLQGHTGAVMCVVFSQDGTHIVSGSIDRTVRVWDASTGNVLCVMSGHGASCTSVAISGDGSRVVSGSDDKIVRTWDTMTGRAHRTFMGHDGAVKGVAFSLDGSRICSGGDDKTVRVWNVSTGLVQSILQGHTGALNSVAFSRDGLRIVSGAWDMTVRVWDASPTLCKLQKVLQGHSNGVWSVAFSEDGTRIVSGSSDQTGRVWDSSTGSLLWSLKGHTSIVTSIAISTDGKKVVSGSYDKTARVWDALTGNQLNTLQGHTDVVWSVAISPDGRRVATGAFDNTIRIWDVSAAAS